MKFSDLKLNRFGYKSIQQVGTPNTEELAANNAGAVPLPANNIATPKDNSKNAREIITGTVITNCFIQTSALPNRVELSDNDAKFYDDSEGGSGAISGDSASIQFIRADKKDGGFIIQKRHGKNDDLENVFEMYYTEAASGGQKNYIFIGRNGTSSAQNFSDLVILHAVQDVRAEIDAVHDYNQRPSLYITDYNKVDNTKQGILSWMTGEGRDGFAGIGKMVEVLTFSAVTSFAVGDTITGNTTGATARLIFKIDSQHFYADHTNALNFDPATDNACTTNGAGGGSGTGNLSANSYATALLLYTDPSLNAILGGNFLPDTDNTYDIGSSSFRIKDLYIGGSIIGGGGSTPTVLQATRDISLAGGVVNIPHGLGRVPSFTEIQMMGVFGTGLPLTSIGTFDGVNQKCNYYSINGATLQGNNGTGFTVACVPLGGTNFQTASISADATNIIFTWSKTGAPTGIAQLFIKVF